TQADIRALLKPDQQKKFDELKKEQDQRRAEWSEFKAWKAEKATKAQ
ncbi:MAG: LTXXQ domain protein, partial [Pseudomonas sp.]